MTTIKQNRKKLNEALEDKALTLLLISDDIGTQAEQVHDAADELLKSGQEVFLITDLDVLTPTEKKHWFEEGGHYVVVGGRNRVVAIRGMLTDLFLSAVPPATPGEPSPIEIRAVLARGDLLP